MLLSHRKRSQASPAGPPALSRAVGPVSASPQNIRPPYESYAGRSGRPLRIFPLVPE